MEPAINNSQEATKPNNCQGLKEFVLGHKDQLQARDHCHPG